MKKILLVAWMISLLPLSACSALGPVILPSMTAPALETTAQPLPATPAEAPPSTSTAPPVPTGTPEAPATPTPTSVQVASRLPLPPGGMFVADSTTEDPLLIELVKAQARVLAIPAPYSWELIQVPGRERFTDVRAHYIMTLIKQEHRVIYDDKTDPDACLLKTYSGHRMVIVRCLKTPPPPFVIVYFLD